VRSSFRAENISVVLGRTEILAGSTVTVLPGTIHALVGPNGAGKSTLLRSMCGDHPLTSGRISLNGRPLDDIGFEEQAELRSVMSQSSHIAFEFIVEDVLRMGWVRGADCPAADFERALQTIVAECEIGHLLARSFNTLSGGEQQRVQFARSLIQIWSDDDSTARYLLLDEPTASLDLAHELLVLRLARRAAERGTGVLVVLHDLNLAARFADTVSIMREGRVAACGKPEDVFADDTLSAVYRTPVTVERHSRLDRLVVFS